METKTLLRYKVIANYPCAMYEVGSIIITYESAMAYITQIDDYSDKLCLNDYPAIFRKMEWWEEVEEKDLPQYLKVNTEKSSLFNGHIHKVRHYGKYEYAKAEINVGASEIFARIEGKEDIYRFNLSHFIPATEQEYNDFMKTR